MAQRHGCALNSAVAEMFGKSLSHGHTREYKVNNISRMGKHAHQMRKSKLPNLLTTEPAA
jgi:hypothetical protein